MPAKILDGMAVAERIKKEVSADIEHLNIKPRLDVILVGNNPASEIYVNKKKQACQQVGIESHIHKLDDNISYHGIEDLIQSLNENTAVHGILLQLPVPGKDGSYFFDKLSTKKDVDVFHPENVGLLVQGKPRFIPCTPHAVQLLLIKNDIDLDGKHCVIINRSLVVGRPLSSMLIQENGYANATVTVCHDRTEPDKLKKITREADIVVVAVGIPGFLTADMVSEHSIIVDVGITRIGNRVVGDVAADVWEKVSMCSPVPKGVGPCTIACLMLNTVKAARFCTLQ